MMKIAVVGGGSVRAPLLMAALARRAGVIGLDEVTLLDLDERKLDLIGPICRFGAERAGANFRLSWTDQAREALTGASAVITTIRVGGEEARVRDERIALRHGVLGQETTGPAGFAMALRSISAVAGYARLMREVCPAAWLLNFTNPAGLVVQGLVAEFPDLKIAGICDTPSSLRREVAHLFQRTAAEVPVRVFGLNHLSWIPDALVDGQNVVPEIIADESLRSRIHQLSFFEPDLLRLIGMLPNEYLYYYYYREQALAHVEEAGETRAEQVQRLSGELMRDLAEINPAAHPERAWQRYHRYLAGRHGTYMAAETGGSRQEDQAQEEAEAPEGEEGEGYAGVALDILAAERGEPATVVVNVPNQGAVPGMRDDDVVEVACLADATGLHPLPAGPVPEDALLLMEQVKLYERHTVEALRQRSRSLAIEALMAHPLVGSYSLARSLVASYLTEDQPWVGDWS